MEFEDFKRTFEGGITPIPVGDDLRETYNLSLKAMYAENNSDNLSEREVKLMAAGYLVGQFIGHNTGMRRGLGAPSNLGSVRAR